MQRVVSTLVDDVDGSEAENTIRFTFVGVEYEIDLSPANTKAYMEAMKPWADAARRVGGRRQAGVSAGSSSATAKAGVDSAAVRAWAKAEGMSINDRGRINAEIVQAYMDRGNKPPVIVAVPDEPEPKPAPPAPRPRRSTKKSTTPAKPRFESAVS